jgi:hypothetical protein
MKLFYQIAHTYNYTPHTMHLFAEKADLKIIDITDAEVYPLIALMAHKDASYPEVNKERVSAGSDWQDVVARHARKRFLNTLRGSVKQVLIAIGGKSFKERVKLLVDRLVHYRY